jgi:hypothetical protein
MKTQRRALKVIEADLSLAVQGKNRSILTIGKLLNEAKAVVGYGKFLAWLQQHTGLSERTARNYMAAATWAAEWVTKSAIVADLEAALAFIAPRAIYALASGKYNDAQVTQVLKAAAQGRHLSVVEVKKIAKSEATRARDLAFAAAAGLELKPEEAARAEAFEADAAKRQADAAAERAAVDVILDGGPDPDLPPASEAVLASSETFHVATFEKAIGMLRSVETKPLRTFATANVSRDVLRQIARFLDEVANTAVAKQPAPAPQTLAAE